VPFSDYLPKLAGQAAPWLAQTVGYPYWQKIGLLFDSVRDRIVQGVKVRWAGFAPTDALDEIGRDRQLPRSSGEGDVAYAVRLVKAWTTWGGDNTPLTGTGGGAGSHLALLNALALLGLPTGTTGATIVQQNGRYAQLVAGVLTYGTLMNCINRQDLTGAVPGNLKGWTFEGRDQFYSEFGIVFPADVAALTVGSVLASQVNAVARKWKPGKAIYVGCWVIATGRTLGWPTGRTLGTDPNLGGNVIRYIPPPEGNRIGYSP
jgi:hypothetical protein